ncbi:hypothetical protein AB0D54_37570 [Streptomyces xanthophaeus]|uniref:hypothetical protein n=1 Tax=Streptomyces xanthophaeus TaxID=67385 RepID=UPI003414BFC9
MVAAADYKFDVFIAFAPEDSGTQRTVRHILDEAKVRTESVYGETALDLDPERLDLCRNFLLLATPRSDASAYVRDLVGYWSEHRDMRSFHILNVSGDRSSHRTTRSWPGFQDIGPVDPQDRQPAAVWEFAALRSPEGARRLASALTAGRIPKPEEVTPGATPRSASRTRALQPGTLLGTLVGIFLLALLTTAWISTRSLLASSQQSGLGPNDAPAAVASIVSIGTVIGVLIGGTLTGLAKLIQARGQKDADLVRANAELLRAEADMVRAKAGLPPTDAPAPIALPAPGEAEQTTP